MIYGNPKKLLASLLVAVMVVTSMPYSAYAAESDVIESEINERQSGEETKMPEETVGEKRFEDTKTDTQESGEEGSTNESVTDTVEQELSTDEIQDSKEEPATETLEQEKTQTDMDETLTYEEMQMDTEESLEEDEALAAGNGVAEKLEALKSTYPDGKYWWRVDGVNSSVTDKSCPSQPKDKYGLCYGTGSCGYYDNGFKCYQCVAFAYMLYYNIFGENPSNYEGNRTDTANIMVGDYVRFKNGPIEHSAIVIGKNGNMLVLAESNWRGPCKISWGREYSVNYVIGFCHASNYDTVNDKVGSELSGPFNRVILDGDYHIITGVDNNMGLEIAGPSLVDGGNAQIYHSIEAASQIFHLEWLGADKGYKITHKLSGKSLTVDGEDKRLMGLNVDQWEWYGSNGQMWIIDEVDEGSYCTIRAKSSGFYLNVKDGKAEDCNNVQMWEKNSTNAHKWRFIPVGTQTIENGDYYIVTGLDNNMCLSVEGTQFVNGDSAVIYHNKNTQEQVFTVTYQNDGYYKIIHKQSGRSLTVDGVDKTLKGLRADIWDWDESYAGQKWVIREGSSSYYMIQSQVSGHYLDVDSSQTADGTNIYMWSGYGTNNQQWKFVPYTGTVDVEKLTLNKTALTLQVGETVTLSAAISPSNATNKTLTWQSSNTSVADVDNNGTVIAKSEGTAVITVISANGKTADCQVTVTKEEVHTHIYSDSWKSNADSHWHECECGEKSDVGVHSFVQAADNTQYEECIICGYRKDSDKSDDNYGDILKEDIPEDGKIPKGLWLAEIKPQTYTGKAIKPEVRVYDHKTLLKEKKDYTLSYKNNTNAGDVGGLKPPTITVTGKGNYKGKETQTFTISSKNLADADITADNIALKENGKAQKPVPTITWNNKKLTKKKDYMISYPNEATDGAYVKTGTYSIRVKGVGNYTGERTITLTITQDAVKPSKKISLNKANAELQFGKIASYTGNAIKPDRYTLTFTTKDASGNNSTVTLREGNDYKVSYQNNVKAGKASILFQGINNYSGTLRKDYNITPYDIETDADKKIKITLLNAYAYTKGGCKPKPIVMFGKTTLTEGTDYTLSYQNNTNLSDDSNTEKAPTVIIKGKGNFKGTCKETFAIRPKDIGALTLTAADKTWQNKSNLYKTKIVIKDEDGKALNIGKDYNNTILYEYDSAVTLADGTTRNVGETVSSLDIIPAGTTIRVTVKADGENYTGTLTGTYRIVKADIGKASVKIPPQIYTGKPIEPDESQITVKLNGQKLSEEDYDISCSNNINKGTATMIIKGKNDCGGTKTVKFKIKEKGFLWWWR